MQFTEGKMNFQRKYFREIYEDFFQNIFLKKCPKSEEGLSLLRLSKCTKAFENYFVTQILRVIHYLKIQFREFL